MINIRETVEFKEFGFKVVKCPCCGEETLDNFWVCENCGWEYDGITEKNIFSNVNNSTINDYIIYISKNK